mmetsp:Transcript_76376/g.218732  ORF Transcript_76376/g.218732 Transcript_76376/m.218732 type:complete len:911 (-) Transcript_76376:125-2857(-)
MSGIGASACEACGSGTYAGSEGSVVCTDCPVGYYASSTALSVCQECDLGRHAAETGKTTCDKCNAGKFQNKTGKIACELCERGRAQGSSGQSACELCERGKYTARNTTVDCTACTSGKYQDAEGQTECIDCEMGKSQSTTGREACESCDAGKYSDDVGANKCTECEDGTSSKGGSRSCTLCLKGYYFPAINGSAKAATGECTKCPEGGDCDRDGVTLDEIESEPYYYRFAITSTELYACPYPENCKGGSIAKSLNDQCKDGSEGHLCETCSSHFYLREATRSCTNCARAEATWYYGPLIFIVLTMVAGALYTKTKEFVLNWLKSNKERLNEIGLRLTALFVTMQIITLVKTNHSNLGGSEMPTPYGGFLESMSFFGFDLVQLLPLNCFSKNGNFGHMQALLLMTLSPLVILVLVLLLECVLKARAMGAKDKEKKQTGEFGHNIALFLQGIMLILPAVSRRVFQSFRCDVFDNGNGPDVSLLAADHNIDCNGSDYGSITAYAALMVLLYPLGVPIAFYITLRRFRSQLDPRGVPEAKVIEMRNVDEDTRNSIVGLGGQGGLFDDKLAECATNKLFADEPITAFARPYRPQYWYFEAYIMFRRIVLTSGSLCFEYLSSMIVFVLAVSIVTLVFEDQAKPHINTFLSAFCYCMSWQVVLCILTLLLLDADMTSDSGAMLISVALLVANLGLIAVVLKDTKTKKKRNERELKLQHTPSAHITQLQEADEIRARSRSSAMKWTSAGLARPSARTGTRALENEPMGTIDEPMRTISGDDSEPNANIHEFEMTPGPRLGKLSETLAVEVEVEGPGLQRTGTDIELFHENPLRDNLVPKTLRKAYAQHEISAWSAEWFETGKIPKDLKKACKLLKISKDDLEEWLKLASTTHESMGGFDHAETNPMHDNPMHAVSGDI